DRRHRRGRGQMEPGGQDLCLGAGAVHPAPGLNAEDAMSPAKRMLALLALTLAGAAPAAVQGPAGAAPKPAPSPQCYRAPLSEEPFWISSAEWIDSRSQIALVDPLKNKVLLYSRRGEAERLNDSRLYS